MVASALIGAGASLLGGLFGRKKEKSAQTNSRDAIMGQARGSREAADKYGFNPLTLLGASSAVGPSQSANYLGSAIADAGMLLADGLAKRQDKIGREAALAKQNEELKLQVRELTLRPKFGGIYAQRQAVPSLGAALGRSASRGSREDPVPDYVGDLARGPRSNDVGQRPPRNPFDREPVMVPVRDIGGVPRLIPQPVAQRLDLAPWGQMVMEDQETLYGDEGGQVLSVPRLGDAIAYHSSGLPPAPVRGKSAIKPYWVGPPKSAKPSKRRVTREDFNEFRRKMRGAR